MNSRTPDGLRTGIIAAMNACSLWCGSVDDLQVWSSPAIASTPPCFAVPAMLACLKTSPLRSTPGPLPYHIANTPSTVAFGSRLTICVPHTEVAASSSFRPGVKVMLFFWRCFFAFHISWSTEPSGEPR